MNGWYVVSETRQGTAYCFFRHNELVGGSFGPIYLLGFHYDERCIDR